MMSSSSPDSRAAPVEAESDSGMSRNGLRSLVVCGSHLSHSSTRDELITRIGLAEELIERQAAGRSGARALLKRMSEMPSAFPWAMVSTKDLGTKECRAWQSVPVLGPIGMLGNWWRIRMSSGCP